MSKGTISEAARREAALLKAQKRVEHLAHICDQNNAFQMFVIGALGYILEALNPALAEDVEP